VIEQERGERGRRESEKKEKEVKRERERENNDNAIQRKIQWKFEIDRNAATCDTCIRIRELEFYSNPDYPILELTTR
jgi:hypothetical protein